MKEPRPTMISARPLEMRSRVAKSWKTRTGSSELRTVTAEVRRMFCGARGRGGEKDGGRRGDVFLAMVFADAVDVHAGAIGEFDLLEELVNAFCAEFAGRAAGAERCLYEAVNTDLHDAYWMIEAYATTHGSDCVRMFQ